MRLLRWIAGDDPGFVVEAVAAFVCLVLLLIASAASAAMHTGDFPRFFPGETVVSVSENENVFSGELVEVISGPHKGRWYQVRFTQQWGEVPVRSVDVEQLMSVPKFYRKGNAIKVKPANLYGIPLLQITPKEMPK